MSTREEDNFSRSFRNAVHHALSETAEACSGRSTVAVYSPKGRIVVFFKTNRPNTTPTVRAICTFAVYFLVFRPFCRFTLVNEGHYVLYYKEKTRAVRLC